MIASAIEHIADTIAAENSACCFYLAAILCLYSDRSCSKALRINLSTAADRKDILVAGCPGKTFVRCIRWRYGRRQLQIAALGHIRGCLIHFQCADRVGDRHKNHITAVVIRWVQRDGYYAFPECCYDSLLIHRSDLRIDAFPLESDIYACRTVGCIVQLIGLPSFQIQRWFLNIHLHRRNIYIDFAKRSDILIIIRRCIDVGKPRFQSLIMAVLIHGHNTGVWTVPDHLLIGRILWIHRCLYISCICNKYRMSRAV